MPVGNLIVTLAKAINVFVSAEESKRLALWAAKSAAVRASMDKGLRVIPDAHYQWIKDNLAPPPYTYIWLEHCEAPFDTWTRHLRVVISDKNLENPIQGHCTTIVLGELVFHIIGFSATHNFATIEDIDSIIRLGGKNCLQHLWPNLSAFQWPLEKQTFSERGLKSEWSIFSITRSTKLFLNSQATRRLQL